MPYTNLGDNSPVDVAAGAQQRTGPHRATPQLTQGPDASGVPQAPGWRS